MKRPIVIVGAISIIVFLIALIIALEKVNCVQPDNEMQLDSDIIFGNIDAKYSIVAYIDYNCSHCKRFFYDTYPKLHEEYLQRNRLKLILRLVCNQTDQKTLEAYQSAICINKYGDYQKLHKLLLHNTEVIYSEQYQTLMDEIIWSNDDIAECLLSNNNTEILTNIQSFKQLKTTGTPTFIINNKVLVGYKDFADLERIINKEYSNIK